MRIDRWSPSLRNDHHGGRVCSTSPFDLRRCILSPGAEIIAGVVLRLIGRAHGEIVEQSAVARSRERGKAALDGQMPGFSKLQSP
jgi:hypothetical protein